MGATDLSGTSTPTADHDLIGVGRPAPTASSPGTTTASTAPPKPSDGLPASAARASAPSLGVHLAHRPTSLPDRCDPVEAGAGLASTSTVTGDLASGGARPTGSAGGRLPVTPPGVRARCEPTTGRPMLLFRIEATDDLAGLATGAFDQPSVGWPVFTPAERLPRCPDGLRALAFQHCEFGCPAEAGPTSTGSSSPHRPPTGGRSCRRARRAHPARGAARLLPRADDRAQRRHRAVRVARRPRRGRAGFATELAVLAGDGPAGLPRPVGRCSGAGRHRPRRPLARRPRVRPSYWTDNGAAYWYRTEPGHDPAGSIVAARRDLRAGAGAGGRVQLDSWFYPHAELRPFDTDEWVSRRRRWWRGRSARRAARRHRDSALAAGRPAARRPHPPPVLEGANRRRGASRGGRPHAAPATPSAYERWLDQGLAGASRPSSTTGWSRCSSGSGGSRPPGRARAWQEGIDRAARERGITLQWCMATPADFAQTTTLTQVTSIRTCGDHGYIATAGQLWAWFCTTNALARSLGLMPFKDVFRADPEVAGDNGEPEALLSALSTGPVGLGDRVGRFDPALALRTCRADGILVKPDVPIAATDESMLANAGVPQRAAGGRVLSTTPPGGGPTWSGSTPTPPTSPSAARSPLPIWATAPPRRRGGLGLAGPHRHPAGAGRHLARRAGPRAGPTSCWPRCWHRDSP